MSLFVPESTDYPYKKIIPKTIAIIYDFDGTLSPRPMQEYTILPKLGVEPQEFWQQVNDWADKNQAELMLGYMYLLLEKARQQGLSLQRQDFVAMGSQLKYFKGVSSWFERINQYVEDKKQSEVSLRHYVISAGLKEILEGSSIYHKFSRVYASEYFYDDQQQPTFPQMLITDTSKTQFLFRINKGLELPRENINEHMPEHLRPIPFENMIYIGDGLTDVPSMAVVKQQGGHALSVYDPYEASADGRKGVQVCHRLLKAGRIDFFAEADFSENSQLERLTKLVLTYVMEKINYKSKVLFDENQ